MATARLHALPPQAHPAARLGGAVAPGCCHVGAMQTSRSEPSRGLVGRLLDLEEVVAELGYPVNALRAAVAAAHAMYVDGPCSTEADMRPPTRSPHDAGSAVACARNVRWRERKNGRKRMVGGAGIEPETPTV